MKINDALKKKSVLCVYVKRVKWRSGEAAPVREKIEATRDGTPSKRVATDLSSVTGRGRLDSPVALLLICLTLGVLAGYVLQGELFLPGKQVIGLLKEGCAGALLAFTLRGGGGKGWEGGRQ